VLRDLGGARDGNGARAVAVSALTGEGADQLLELIVELLPDPRERVQALVPWDRADLVAAAHEHGEVHATEHREDGTLIDATVPVSTARALQTFPPNGR
jgi:GTP-binding protein HflX